ncbi:hypothetical protein OVA07_19010 [Novosphingobium sp. SL115]|uniref:hypothetical protein n=1 Tax=Novosphingobium sp. SL115 TaxID=2995150 RepID=UPI002272FF55|nr:hypothetical protein [Novosphingobium sp. SL115]MCY1673100.1 hypothetical protein [Novosphingobium sp. SL115]
MLAGTLIENTATATYTSGSSGGTVTSNKVTVKVDELLDVAVATLSTTPSSASSAPAVLTYSVTNAGNGPEAFNLVANPQVSGNAFDGTVTAIVLDSNDNGVYDAGVDQVLTSGAATPALSPDGALKVFVLVTLPAGASDAQTSQVRLVASAVTGTGTPGSSFSGQGEGGGDAVVGLTTASANSLASLVASLANVALTKSAVIVDQFGTAKPVPGATVTYTIAANVTGSGSAEGLHIVDAIPAGTTYVPGSLKLDASALTDAADTDAGVGGTSGIDVALGTIAGGSTRTVNFAVTIN